MLGSGLVVHIQVSDTQGLKKVQTQETVLILDMAAENQVYNIFLKFHILARSFHVTNLYTHIKVDLFASFGCNYDFKHINKHTLHKFLFSLPLILRVSSTYVFQDN